MDPKRVRLDAGRNQLAGLRLGGHHIGFSDRQRLGVLGGVEPNLKIKGVAFDMQTLLKPSILFRAAKK